MAHLRCDLAATARAVDSRCEEELILVWFLLAQNKFTLPHESAGPTGA